MSTATTLGSEWASEDWQLAEEDGSKPISFVVQLRRHVHVFPYSRLVFAEGDHSLVRIAFSSHLVTVTGHGLAALLAAVASQRILRVTQPMESEAKFGVRGVGAANCRGPGITSITVEKFK